MRRAPTSLRSVTRSRSRPLSGSRGSLRVRSPCPSTTMGSQRPPSSQTSTQTWCAPPASRAVRPVASSTVPPSESPSPSAPDAGERVQLATGLVPETDPDTHAIGIGLLERVRPLEPRGRDEPHLARDAACGRGLGSGSASAGDHRHHARHEYGRVARRHGSDAAIGPTSGPAPSGFASCPSPAYNPPRLRTRSGRIVASFPKVAASSAKASAPSCVRNTLTSANSPGSPTCCSNPWKSGNASDHRVYGQWVPTSAH